MILQPILAKIIEKILKQKNMNFMKATKRYNKTNMDFLKIRTARGRNEYILMDLNKQLD